MFRNLLLLLAQPSPVSTCPFPAPSPIFFYFLVYYLDCSAVFIDTGGRIERAGEATTATYRRLREPHRGMC